MKRLIVLLAVLALVIAFSVGAYCATTSSEPGTKPGKTMKSTPADKKKGAVKKPVDEFGPKIEIDMMDDAVNKRYREPPTNQSNPRSERPKPFTAPDEKPDKPSIIRLNPLPASPTPAIK
ncbi:MAG: hypothetical protein WAW37_07905 [Syntrophobacteraceae bacterium]